MFNTQATSCLSLAANWRSTAHPDSSTYTAILREVVTLGNEVTSLYEILKNIKQKHKIVSYF